MPIRRPMPLVGGGILIASAILLGQAPKGPALNTSGTIYGSFSPVFEGNGA